MWAALARKRKVRLPKAATPLTTARMEKWLRKAGISLTEYKDVTGLKSMKHFIDLNPDWSLRGWAGTTLECLC